RNRMMIHKSNRLIAVHDGAASGGTKHTIDYAISKGLEITIIDPHFAPICLPKAMRAAMPPSWPNPRCSATSPSSSSK
ncbi:hypothetical protein LJC63_02125, partial [Ruminococcaceae bacterium OttesenSCG-928-L11]|nr:hypothetical protein [Ruminococcaceae bacterium OttesenSCG-928-L11]